jgi:hypothetical protein
MSTNRYLVFAGDNYYPQSDCRDFVEAFDDVKKAYECAKMSLLAGDDWACIFDVESTSTVWSDRSGNPRPREAP